MMLIISSSWHLLVGEIHWAASEYVVLKVDVLETGKIGQIVIATGSKHLQNCCSCGVFPDCSAQYLSKVAQERNSGEPATGSWVAKAH